MHAARRALMIDRQLRVRGISDARVLDAMRHVPRHDFVPDALIDHAYDDKPLAIGDGQTISQPYVVALMSQMVQPKKQYRCLDVGTGCGYQAAVMSLLCEHVDSIEIRPDLAAPARERLANLGYNNVTVHVGNGANGLTECAPFDVIVVAASGANIPPPLLEQLAPGGRLIAPVGDATDQALVLVEKSRIGVVTMRAVAPVRFVPLVVT
jgi:protein-L-isoaspartate(D-aspartate) O-methyltransferase